MQDIHSRIEITIKRLTTVLATIGTFTEIKFRFQLLTA